ncbi:BTB/POZ domain-containing protein At1g67900-like [Selaginella moellendorffii]|uniref:BTB/POZ domain-containing protein At1g67900-like n=1 Tax=Selaginella moellendorffii TaxID=88036 RepID=UPI000D1C2FC1|nr:BTB/POZ domain-containing protein At1g67900-like [Selaginella moellendorffii]|eukprot:XP_024522034.1 BTB/POZ domain-containing protein At1g67900-like [Selaginella moellendorffii]
MKYMKLGSKPDIFQSHGSVTIVVSDLTSDVSVEVNGARFLLHKFPLLSKSGRLHKLVAEARDSSSEEIPLPDFPGGAEIFELCAKFCYGITITLNAYNVVAVRCAAEYLDMSESIEKGNMIFKLEVFLNSSIFRSWKDSIIALKSTKGLLPWSEDLKIVSRCIDSISSKTSVDPSKVDWSYTYTRITPADQTPASGSAWNSSHSRRLQPVPKDWWVEDVCELEIDFFWRVMLAIKAKGRMSHELIGEAVRIYAYRWLPGLSKEQNLIESSNNLGGGGIANTSGDFAETTAKHRLLLETIVSLLPPEKACTSCSFLLKLLKAATMYGAASSAKNELARRVGLQLEEASVSDLLIPSVSYSSGSLYDVDLVQRIVENFLMQDQSPPMSPSRARIAHERRRTRSAENLDFAESRRSTSATHSAKLRVAKLLDGYLAEVARDANLPLSKFMALAEAIPDFARPVHDGIYRAIDIYLKEHPSTGKSEKKKLCRMMDCKKLSMEACMHAAQNDRLPLRVVVQVLFFEQVRAAVSGGLILNDIPNNIKALLPAQDDSIVEAMQSSSTTDDNWDAVHHDFKALKGDLANMKQRIAEAERERSQIEVDVIKQGSNNSTAKSSSKRLFSGSRKMLTKFFSTKLGNSETTSKSSDTSRSSGSPVSGTVSSGKTSVARR